MKYRRGMCVECGIEASSEYSYYCHNCREKAIEHAVKTMSDSQ